jgi:hypothetical protein
MPFPDISGIKDTVQLTFVGADVWGDQSFEEFHSSINSVVLNLKFAY